MRLITIALFSILTNIVLAQQLHIRQLRCQNLANPLGIQETNPVLSWQLVSTKQNVMQKAYQIWVSDNKSLLAQNKGNIWDSGKTMSSNSIQIKYNGKPLDAHKTYYWKVQVWDNQQQTSSSPITSWQMGLLTKTDWHNAQWIAYERLADSLASNIVTDVKKDKVLGSNILPMFRKNLTVNKTIAKATMYMAGLGHFELSINGAKIGDNFLDAGWTKYDKEAQYVIFDLTQQLRKGTNTVGIMLGNGFYYIPPVKGRYRKHKAMFGYPKMICRLVLDFTDGSFTNIISDNSWKTAPSPITFSSIYGGEDYNANLEQKDWNTATFDDTSWKNALIVDGPPSLVSQCQEPLKVFQKFVPVSLKSAPKNSWTYDFGQNLSGIINISLQGKKGDTVRIYPAELINADQSANQKASGSPYYFQYILKGQGIENWQPRFSYYGFRYAQIRGAIPLKAKNEGNKKLPIVLSINSLHIRQAASTVGHFSCSNSLFNQTHNLIDWGIRSNMASVLTDCPHREKLGWLEQLHLMGASVRFRYDILNLLKKQMADMRNSQLESGLVPAIAPEYVKFDWGDGMFRDSPEWGSSSIIVPWYLYLWYGDVQELNKNYDMMKNYISYLESKADNHILKQGLSDWYDLGPKSPGVSQLTPMGVTGTAIFYYDLQIMQKIAQMLNKPKDVERFVVLADEVKKAFNDTFFNKEKKYYATNSQTANAMALFMELADNQDKNKIVDNLINDIRSRNNSLTAGDVGYRYLLRALEDAGRSDVIFDMNSRSDVAGYGYQLAKGATALTESWEALPTVSNNHFMLGHLMEWLYSGLAGIKQSDNSVAFQNIVIAPQPVGDVSWVDATYECPYGQIESKWKMTKEGFELSVKIPANMVATVVLPNQNQKMVFQNNKKIENISNANRKSYIKIGSGNYRFVVRE